MPTVLDAPVWERAKFIVIIIILTAVGFIVFRIWYELFSNIYKRIVPKKHEKSLGLQLIWALGLSSVFILLAVLLGIVPF